MSSTKNVWRLKKYSRSEQEIQQQQTQFQELEFSTKPQNPHTIRRPNNQRKKPGETQEFVFVDLSPKKKASPVNQDKPLNTNRVDPDQLTRFNIEEKKKPINRVARLFRSSSSSNNTIENIPIKALKSSLQLDAASFNHNVPQQLMLSPTIVQQASSSSSSSPMVTSSSLSLSNITSKYQFSASSPIAAYTPSTAPPLKRSFTSVLESHRAQSQITDISRQRSNSSTSLLLGVSDSGRAFLTTGMNPISQSSTDLNSLSRSNSRRSPIPSPQRVLSPTIQSSQKFPILEHPDGSSELEPSSNSENEFSEESDDDSDAFKAFSKLVRKNTNGRKRTNTVGSISSNSNVVKPTGLVRQHSVSSITSKYGRVSPTRVRHGGKASAITSSAYSSGQFATQSFPDLPSSQDQFNFFEDINAKTQQQHQQQPQSFQPKPYIHAKNFSISNIPTPSATPTAEVDTGRKNKPFVTSLGPPLDVDRLLALDDDGLQSPGIFSAVSEQKFEFMSGMNINMSQGFEMDNQNDDPFDFNAFINYDTTIGNEVN